MVKTSITIMKKVFSHTHTISHLKVFSSELNRLLRSNKRHIKFTALVIFNDDIIIV